MSNNGKTPTGVTARLKKEYLFTYIYISNNFYNSSKYPKANPNYGKDIAIQMDGGRKEWRNNYQNVNSNYK